jgi:hypothetical protein
MRSWHGFSCKFGLTVSSCSAATSIASLASVLSAIGTVPHTHIQLVVVSSSHLIPLHCCCYLLAEGVAAAAPTAAAPAAATVAPQAVTDAQGAAGTAEADQWGGGWRGGDWQDWRYYRPGYGYGGAWRPPGDSAWGW